MNWRKTLSWGLILRCPNCGQGGLFRQWLRMVDRCPRCGLHFEREEGYWSGAVAINTVVTELVFFGILAIAVILTWPDPPLAPLLIGALLVNVLFPLFFYPFSKTIWVAIDLCLHPLEEREQHEVTSLREKKQQLNAD